jgi:hypothetical protein
MTNATNRIKLNNVRISYPSLFKPRAWQNDPTKLRYEATFILDKVEHAKEIGLINNQIDLLLSANKTTRAKIKPDHFCLKDGDLNDKEEYKNAFTIKARNIKKVPLVNKDGSTPITEENNPIYGGCFVSAYITLWLYNKINTGITATLGPIQFRKDGTAFNNQEMDMSGAFDPVAEEYVDMF